MKEGIIKLVVDTNTLFMSFYNPRGKAARIIEFAIEGRLELFSPESVKDELFEVIKREFGFPEFHINFLIDSLPIKWVGKEIYKEAINKTEVKHKADKPVEALALILNCEILSADEHFKSRIDINKLLFDF